jgi:RNA polymerase sigma-B factor
MDGVSHRHDGGLAVLSHTTNSAAQGERPSIGGCRLAESERASAHAVTSVVANDRAANRREERRLLLRSTVQVTRAPATSLCTDFSRSPARRYQHGGEPMDDLVQIASLGLLKAIDRFDPSRETTLSTFATPTILGELKRYFRDHGWAVHVPRSLKERAARLEEATEALWGELGRPPTLTEIARASDATPDQVLEAGQVASAYCAIALDIYEHESEGISPAERLGIEDPGFTTAEQAATLEPLMSSLNERQQEVLRLRFGEDLVHSEIGWRIGVSAMHASRLIKQSLAIMQKTASRQEQARSASRA